jgi:two-component sensor histidine kinase
MTTTLRLLIIEDSDDDAHLLLHELERAGYAVTCEQVDTAQGLRDALARQSWDLAISDHAMPRLSAPTALALVKAQQPELPFIIVSGEMDLKLAVAAMQAGADDFISKRELARLTPAIERALREAEARRERLLAEAALRQSEARYRALAEENARLAEQARQDAQTKTRLLQEVNHRVKNNLAAIIGLLYAQQRRAQPDQADGEIMVEELINQISGLAKVHDLLSAAEWSPIALDELARQIISTALKAVPSYQRVTVDVPPSPLKVTPRQANSLALIINELTTNTLKHVLAERRAVRIGIHIACDAGVIVFAYEDDGPGYPEAILRRERQTMGLYLIESLAAHDLNGQLELRNTPHPVTTLRFKNEIAE